MTSSVIICVCLFRFSAECEQLGGDLGRWEQQPPPANPRNLSCRPQSVAGDVLVSCDDALIVDPLKF